MAYQVSVFVENKVGALEAVTSALREENVNMRTMNLTHTASGWGILNFVANDPGLAFKVLQRRGIPVVLRKIVALEMDDKAGGLDDLLRKIKKANVNFTTAYAHVVEEGSLAFFAIDVEDMPQAEELLNKAGIRILPDSIVYGHKK